MKNLKNKKVITVAIVIAFILFIFRNKIMTLYILISDLLSKFEGFSSKPYWDVRQWTWGYGTRVPEKYMEGGKPKEGVRINKIDAMADAWKYIQNSQNYLQKLINVSLTNNQWAALLSFAYNLGDGNADNLVANINSKKWDALENQWKAYNKIKKNGSYVVSKALSDRRREEWNLFSSSLN